MGLRALWVVGLSSSLGIGTALPAHAEVDAAVVAALRDHRVVVETEAGETRTGVLLGTVDGKLMLADLHGMVEGLGLGEVHCVRLDPEALPESARTGPAVAASSPGGAPEKAHPSAEQGSWSLGGGAALPLVAVPLASFGAGLGTTALNQGPRAPSLAAELEYQVSQRLALGLYLTGSYENAGSEPNPSIDLEGTAGLQTSKSSSRRAFLSSSFAGRIAVNPSSPVVVSIVALLGVGWTQQRASQSLGGTGPTFGTRTSFEMFEVRGVLGLTVEYALLDRLYLRLYTDLLTATYGLGTYSTRQTLETDVSSRSASDLSSARVALDIAPGLQLRFVF